MYARPGFAGADFQAHLPAGQGEPVRVRRLPYIFVKLPSGQFQTIDVRLQNSYAKTVWRTLRTPPSRKVIVG